VKHIATAPCCCFAEPRLVGEVVLVRCAKSGGSVGIVCGFAVPGTGAMAVCNHLACRTVTSSCLAAIAQPCTAPLRQEAAVPCSTRVFLCLLDFYLLILRALPTVHVSTSSACWSPACMQQRHWQPASMLLLEILLWSPCLLAMSEHGGATTSVDCLLNVHGFSQTGLCCVSYCVVCVICQIEACW
jgi:hypothetical protein